MKTFTSIAKNTWISDKLKQIEVKVNKTDHLITVQ